MTDTETRALVDEFIALSRVERRAKYPTLPTDVKARARRVIEARRGIAYRMEGGIAVRTKDELIHQLTHHATKLAEMPQRIEILKERMVEFKRQLQENYGDEALAEAENVLETLEAPKSDEAAANA